MSIGVDAPRVENGPEALFLMLHHLRLAAMYFEATPEADLVEMLPPDDFSRPAIAAWIENMEALYPKEG